MTLTKEGRDLLDARRQNHDSRERQAFHDGVRREHDLPCDDKGHVQFPDVRIEYDIDGRDETLDVEVMTRHYRGAHAAAKAGSGFTLYFSGRSRSGGGGGRTPSIIEEFLR